jgi:hypothetical protein
MHKPDSQTLARHETLDALPAMLTLLRRLVITAFEAGDPDSEELKHLLEDCVVAAHRLRLREKLRARAALEHG